MFIVAMVVIVSVVVVRVCLKSVFSFDSSAGHVASEMSLELNDCLVFMLSINNCSSFSDSRALTIRGIIMFVLIRLTASTTHNIFII